MIIRMNTYIVNYSIENQFVHPSPKGSELIFNTVIYDLGINLDNHLFFYVVCFANIQLIFEFRNYFFSLLTDFFVSRV